MNNTILLKRACVCILFLFMGLYSGSFAQQMGFDLPNGIKKIRIPFEKNNNLIIIPIKLNDQITLKFIVDSGTEHPIITDKSVGDGIGLNYARKISYNEDSPNPIHTYISTNLKMELPGGVKSGSNQAVMVLEKDYFNLRSTTAADVYGLIGYDLFRRFIVEVNNIDQVLILHEPTTFEVPKNYQRIDLNIKKSKPYITTNVTFENWEKLDLDLMVDTGASHAILFDDDSTSFFLPAHSLEVPIGRNFSGDIKGIMGRVRELKIADYIFTEPLASFATSDELYVISENKLAGGGALGGEVLSRFNYILDYHNGAIYMKKTGEFGKSFEYDMSGIIFQRTGLGYKQFQVAQVRENSPAAGAGIQTGDIVKDINGEVLSEDNFGYYLSMLRSKPGKKVSMKLLRGNKEVNVLFKLSRMI